MNWKADDWLFCLRTRNRGIHAFAKSVAWTVATAALLGGSAHAADKAALGDQIAEAMVDIARHGNLHDIAYTRRRLPLPFALTRELSPQSNSNGAAIQYYQLTLTRAQRGTMTMTYLVATQGTLDPESDGTLTSYLHLENLSDYACITTHRLTSLFSLDDRPAMDHISLVSDAVSLYRSDLTEVRLSYSRAADHAGCLANLGISQRNL